MTITHVIIVGDGHIGDDPVQEGHVDVGHQLHGGHVAESLRIRVVVHLRVHVDSLIQQETLESGRIR